ILASLLRFRRAALAAREHGLDVPREQLALAQAALRVRVDEDVDEIAGAGRPLQITEAVGLRAEAYAGDARVDRAEGETRQREARQSQRAEVTAAGGVRHFFSFLPGPPPASGGPRAPPRLKGPRFRSPT